MRYLGGKSRIAKRIAKAISPSGKWWDPFCGGLHVSVELAKIYPFGLISDMCLPLIILYKSIRNGWTPPSEIDADTYRLARLLSDADPLKAFCGFGCSYGGKWFGGFAPARKWKDGYVRDPIGSTARALSRDLDTVKECKLMCASFFDIEPCEESGIHTIYCDPPYNGTTGYDALNEKFDHDKFWDYCGTWTSFGVKVYVSELDCPVPNRVVWHDRFEKRMMLGGRQTDETKKENLFLVL